MGLKRHVLSITAAGGLALAGLAAAVPTHVHATSNACVDNSDDFYVPLVDNTTGMTVGLEIGTYNEPGGPLTVGALESGHYALCVASDHYTAQTTPSTLVGEELAVDVLSGTQYSNPNNNEVNVSCSPDANATISSACDAGSNPTIGINGSNLTVTIPFSVCLGVGTCPNLSNPGYATGAIIGSIQQTPPPPGGSGAAYSLSSLCVEVDGTPVTRCDTSINLGGVITTGQSPVDTTPIGGCGALVCGPGYIGTSGSQLATVYVPGTTTQIPLYGEGQCLYRAQSGPPPSPDPCTQ